MAIDDLIFYLFISIGLIYFIHFGLYTVGANIYDIRQYRRISRMPKRFRTKRPLVSVLIPAHNEEKGIVRCLDSVRKNTYRKIEIIVINDASKDNTGNLVADYICRYPRMSISLINLRKNVGKAGALNRALNRQAQGDLIMTLDADSVLHNRAIKRAVDYFEDENVAGVAANVRIMDHWSILGLLQKFEHMIGYRSKKLYSLTNSEFIIGGVGSMYRRSIMKKVKFYDTDTTTEDIGLSLKIAALGNKDYRLVYGADIVAVTEGVQTFKALLRQRYRWKMGMIQNLLKHKGLFANNNSSFSRSLTMYRIPMAFLGEILMLLEPLMFLYTIYLAIAYNAVGIIMGAYMVITLYILWNLWPDEHTSLKRKLLLSLYTPIIYFIFYIMSFVQIVSIYRCLFNAKQITNRSSNGGKWVSPERTGEQITQFS
jgi:biofilm PGA synthesis N-glycosyltransferase PgaC